jgi:Flp pilus assembly protein TadG
VGYALQWWKLTMERINGAKTVMPIRLATEKCLNPGLPLRYKGRSKGQTTVEFALICLPFFVILFAIIDFAEIFFYENSLQNALREACRFATAGRVIQATDASGNPLSTNLGSFSVPIAINDSSGREASRNECIRYWFLSNCILQNFPISNIVITSAATLPGADAVVSTNSLGYLTLLSSNGGPATLGPGDINDYVQITATYKVSTITPLMGYMNGYSGLGSTFPVHVSAIVKNEPATLNFEHLDRYSNEP